MTNGKELIAQRAISPRAYRLKNGNLLVESELLDGFHLIHISLEIEPKERKIIRAKAEMQKVPHDICSTVLVKVKRLKGLVIKKGILKDVSDILGGETGCVHLRNLATIVIDFAAWVLMECAVKEGASPEEFLKGTCVAYPRGG